MPRLTIFRHRQNQIIQGKSIFASEKKKSNREIMRQQIKNQASKTSKPSL
jgi:hypothetical protein